VIIMLSVGDDVIPQDQDAKDTNEACNKLQVFYKYDDRIPSSGDEFDD
jgi:hypothetical protein